MPGETVELKEAESRAPFLCKVCGETDKDKFQKVNRPEYGTFVYRKTRCKKCANKAALGTRKGRVRFNNFEQQREYALLRKYGMTYADFVALLERQGNKCAVCSKPYVEEPYKWHVDHDHKTGRVRGVLCHLCNVGLGSFRDDPDILRFAIAYLGGE